MTHARHIAAALPLAAALLLCACEPERRPIVVAGGTPSFTGFGDIGVVEDAGFQTQVSTLCTPGERACLSENSPLYSECADDGSRYVDLSCPASTVCEEGICVPFNCVPGRPVCVGADAQATCDPTGRGVRDLTTCDGGLVCRGGSCVDLCAEAAEDSSYIGCEYSAIELYNIYREEVGDTEESPYAIVVANPQRFADARVGVTDADGRFARLLRTLDLAPRQQYSFARGTTVRSEIFTPSGTRPVPTTSASLDVPPESAAVLLIDPDISGRGPFNVTSSLPIVAYQYSPYCCNFTASNDASLLLPKATHGSRYRVLSYPTMRFDGTLSTAPYVYVVAHEDGTRVSINGREELVRTPLDSAGVGNPLSAPARNHVVELDAGEAAAFASAPGLSGGDISGTLINANAPVAAFSGHPCTNIPQDRRACDHLEEQLLPADSLGTRYVLHPVHSRNAQSYSEETVYWRVVADADATVTVSPSFDALEATDPSTSASPDCRDLAQTADGASTFTLAAGEVCEFGSRAVAVLDSDAPLLVGGFVSGHESTGIIRYGTQAGDPAFFLNPPLAQTRRDYAFVTSPTFKRTFVSVVAPDRAKLSLDGSFVSTRERLEPQPFTLDGQDWVAFSLSLEPGLHTMSGDLDFGVVVHAYDDYVSYAFPGGLDLTPNPKER
jgi:hypothetical protein